MMTPTIPRETDSVRVTVADREVAGIVEDIRWTPGFNTKPREALSVVVNVEPTSSSTTIVASLDELSPLQ